MESLKEKTAKGLFWGAMNNGVQQLLGMIFGIILARLLSKSDYGMVAMISVFSLVASALQDSGFKVALVNKKNITDRDYNSVFWFNVLMGLSLYIILFLCTPLIAQYYHQPSLIPLCHYAFLGFMINSWGVAPSAYLLKNLKAKQQAKGGMIAVLTSNMVGLLMAFLGCSYWTIATQMIVYSLVNTSFTWYYCEWRPSLRIDFGPVKRMFRFSVKMLITTIMTAVNNNVLNILLGRYYNSDTVGTYNQAYQWDSKAYYVIQGMVNQVAQPVFSTINDELERQRQVLRKMMRFTAFASFPLMFGLALVSREFILVTITSKWLPCVPYMQILCVSGAFMPIYSILSNLIISKGKSEVFMWCTICFGFLQIAMMISLHSFGILTMVISYTVINVLWIGVWQFFVRRYIGYGYVDMLRDLAPFLLIAAAVMAVTYLITMPINNIYVLLAVRIVVAVILYYFVMKVARVKILDECVTFIRNRIGRSHQ